MKRLISTLLFAPLLFMSGFARTYVLATGVSNYGKDDVNLTQTTKDAKRFKELMSTQSKDVSLLTGRNVTKDNVLKQLRAICSQARKGDRIIFFYSGHGMPGAICGYDRPIPYSELTAVLASSQADEKFCFIDACHAGTMVDGANKSADQSGVKNGQITFAGYSDEWTKAVKDNQGQIFFVSCRPDEYSVESQFLGAGFFTQALLKGMRGKADKDNNRNITVMELFRYVYGDVLKKSNKKQHPQLIAPKNMYDVTVTSW